MPAMDTPVRIQISKILLLQKEKLEEEKFDVVKRVEDAETKMTEKDKKIEELAAQKLKQETEKEQTEQKLKEELVKKVDELQK